jgi:hypothetical protein
LNLGSKNHMIHFVLNKTQKFAVVTALAFANNTAKHKVASWCPPLIQRDCRSVVWTWARITHGWQKMHQV